jgi:hypothetical protein
LASYLGEAASVSSAGQQQQRSSSLSLSGSKKGQKGPKKATAAVAGGQQATSANSVRSESIKSSGLLFFVLFCFVLSYLFFLLDQPMTKTQLPYFLEKCSPYKINTHNSNNCR